MYSVLSNTDIQYITLCHWQHYKKYLYLLVEVEDKICRKLFSQKKPWEC